MEVKETKKELEPNEPGSNRGFGCMILEKPPESETVEKDAVRFYSEVAELTREIFGEDKSPAFASGVLAGMELEKNRLKRWAADESEPLPEGEHQAVDESEADEVIEEAVAEAETTKGRDITETKEFKAFVESGVEAIEKVIDGWHPSLQERVLAILLDEQPQRRAEHEAEMARDDAQGDLIDLIGEAPYSVQAKLYRMLIGLIKDSHGELTEAA